MLQGYKNTSECSRVKGMKFSNKTNGGMRINRDECGL